MFVRMCTEMRALMWRVHVACTVVVIYIRCRFALQEMQRAFPYALVHVPPGPIRWILPHLQCQSADSLKHGCAQSAVSLRYAALPHVTMCTACGAIRLLRQTVAVSAHCRALTALT